MQRKHQALILAASAFLAACGGSSTDTNSLPATPTQTATVAATPSIAFTPNTVTVLPGGSVTFNFGSVAHNVFFDNGQEGAPANITGENASVSKTLTFTTPGVYVYNCHIHPGMSGTVVVKLAT
ncbi:MAG: plastocyanin/azurin family copper-binding protein [bacterium]